MAKFILGIAIVCFTSFCGYLLAKKYRQRKLFLKQLGEFNERFLNEIAYFRSPIREFASKYVYKGEFNALLEDFFLGLEERAYQGRERLDFSEYTFLTNDEKEFTESYFLMLGKGDSASQKAYFSAAKEQLKRMETEAENAQKKYGDLYVKLGFLCGLFILILIV